MASLMMHVHEKTKRYLRCFAYSGFLCPPALGWKVQAPFDCFLLCRKEKNLYPSGGGTYRQNEWI